MILNKQHIWLQVVLGTLNACLIPILTAHPASSAERIELSYGILERSIAINSLETYAKTGIVNDDLSVYARYVSSQELSELRQILLTPIPLNVVEVSQFLYTPIGEQLLERLGEFIQTESGLSGFHAVRAALILAAADPQGLTLLNVLRKFPSNAISIDLARSLKIARALQDLVNQTQDAIAKLTAKAVSHSSINNSLQPLPLHSLLLKSLLSNSQDALLGKK
nr:alpha/beta hydrolase [Scytonema hofmannii]